MKALPAFFAVTIACTAAAAPPTYEITRLDKPDGARRLRWTAVDLNDAGGYAISLLTPRTQR